MIDLVEAKDKYKTTKELTLSGFRIPEGFAFDGMSAPWVLRSFVGGPYRPKTVEAVILHDYLYSTGLVDRKKADMIFHNMLKKEDVNCAIIFYWAVRLFGSKNYKCCK